MTKKIAFALVFVCGAAMVSAQTTRYTFSPSGLTFNDVSGTYDTTMMVQGYFETASPLPSYFGSSDISAEITAYSFFDGVQTLDDSNSYIVQALFSTDSGGRPATWGLTFYRDNGAVVGGIDISYSTEPFALTQYDGFTDAVCGIGTPAACESISDFGPNFGFFVEQPPQSRPGRWAVATQPPTSIPTLSGWGLVAMIAALGVAGLRIIRR